MKIKLATLLLLLLATIKVVADVAGWTKVSAAAAVTNAAPAMKVFTAHRGYETFSSTFTLSVFWADGHQQTVTLDPSVYQGLRGPYNRRNVYGAAIAYGPILVSSEHTSDMWRSVAQSAFCSDNRIIDELGFSHPGDVSHVEVSYQPHQHAASPESSPAFPQHLGFSCHED